MISHASQLVRDFILSILIRQSQIVLPDRQTLLGDVYVKDGKIAAIAPYIDLEELSEELSEEDQPVQII